MGRWFRHKEHPGDEYRRERRRIPPAAVILMMIGFLTVLYFLVVYALMPVLAMLTVS